MAEEVVEVVPGVVMEGVCKGGLENEWLAWKWG